IYMRHVHAVLLAEFVRGWQENHGQTIREIGHILTPGPDGSSAPFDTFLADLPEAIRASAMGIDELIPCVRCGGKAVARAEAIRKSFSEAGVYFADEVKMYDEAIADVEERRKQAEEAKKHELAKRLYGFQGFLYGRRNDLYTADWVNFFSDRSVL